MSRPTIKDVAKRTGYSITTVSMVINDKNVKIPQETRNKIWAAIKELNYRPNQLAVSMITKKSRVLGLIIPDNSNIFFADMSKAIECAARHVGYSIVYGNTSNNSSRDIEYIKMFSDRQVDGIIFAKSTALNGSDDINILQYIQNSIIPFVTLDRHIPAEGIKSVSLNHFKGGYLATKHLIQLGHTRIGAFTGPNDLVSSKERLEGYRAALIEAGIQFNSDLIFEGDYQLGKEKEALYSFLNQHATAIFSFNDLMAFGLYRELQKAGFSIPRDISLVGFDNIFFSDIIQPALTTVEQPIDEMGKCAVDTLISLINKTNVDIERTNYIFEPKLIIRDSTRRVEIRE